MNPEMPQNVSINIVQTRALVRGLQWDVVPEEMSIAPFQPALPTSQAAMTKWFDTALEADVYFYLSPNGFYFL